MGGIVGVRLAQVRQGLPGLALLHIQPPVALPHVHDHQRIAGGLGIPERLPVGLRGLFQVAFVDPGLPYIIMEDGIALVPAVLLEERPGLLVVRHRLRDRIHHIVQVADGAVERRIGVVQLRFGVAFRIRGRHRPAGHPFHGRERGLIIEHRAVELLPRVEMLPDVAERICIGCRPPLRLADGQRLAGIEHTLLRVQDVIALHQVPVSPVQLDQLLRGSLVHGVRRPARNGALQRIQVVPAVVGIPRGGQHGQGGHAQQQALFHTAKIQNLPVKMYKTHYFTPFG